MGRIQYLQQQIEKAEAVLAQSREHYHKNPENYSARLLLMSAENYLSDLCKELDQECLQRKDLE